MTDEFKIRTVLFREGDWWVAQCLDYDLAAQARTEKDLQYELGRILVGRIMAGAELGVEPFKGLPPAPRRYWDMFFDAQSQPKTLVPFVPIGALLAQQQIPEVEMRAI